MESVSNSPGLPLAFNEHDFASCSSDPLKGLRQLSAAIDTSDVDAVRGALQEDSGLLLSDAFLRKCLVFQRGNPQLAANTAARFLQLRREAGWPFNIQATEIQRALQTGMHWLLRQSSSSPTTSHWKDGTTGSDGGPAACLVFNMKLLNIDVCPIEEYQKMTLYLMERATDDPEAQRRGVALILDFRGLQVLRLKGILGMHDILRSLRLWVGAFPCRMRRIWLIEPGLSVKLLTSAVLQFLSQKMRERVRITEQTNLAELVNDLSPCVELPPSLGGESSFDWSIVVESYLKDHNQSLDNLQSQQDLQHSTWMECSSALSNDELHAEKYRNAFHRLPQNFRCASREYFIYPTHRLQISSPVVTTMSCETLICVQCTSC